MLQSLGLSDEVAMSGVVSGAHYSFAADGKLLGQYGRAVNAAAVDDRRGDDDRRDDDDDRRDDDDDRSDDGPGGDDTHGDGRRDGDEGDVSRNSCLQDSGRSRSSSSSSSSRTTTPSPQDRSSIVDSVSKKTRFNVHIPRQKLREIMLRHIDPDRIAWDKQMKHFEVISSSSLLLSSASLSSSSASMHGYTPLLPTDKTNVNISSSDGGTNAPLSSSSPPSSHGDGDGDDKDDCIVRAHFEDGSYEDMSCLVGADGIYSVVRKQLQQQLHHHLSNSCFQEQLQQQQQQQQQQQPNTLQHYHDSMSIHNRESHTNHIQLSSPSLSSSSSWKEESVLQYLGFMVILGISKNIIDSSSDTTTSNYNSSSTSTSSTLSKQISDDDVVIRYSQCQWLNGSTRVFSMPYDQHHTMWQLSYPLNESCALSLSASNNASIGNEQCVI